MVIALFMQGKETNSQVESYDPISSRDAFYFLNHTTYYALYPDRFDSSMFPCIPHFLKTDFCYGR